MLLPIQSGAPGCSAPESTRLGCRRTGLDTALRPWAGRCQAPARLRLSEASESWSVDLGSRLPSPETLLFSSSERDLSLATNSGTQNCVSGRDLAFVPLKLPAWPSRTCRADERKTPVSISLTVTSDLQGKALHTVLPDS